MSRLELGPEDNPNYVVDENSSGDLEVRDADGNVIATFTQDQALNVEGLYNIDGDGDAVLIREEDDNSPVEFSGEASYTYTLAGDYDVIYVTFDDVVGGNGSVSALRLQVNGDTGGNYRHYRPNVGGTSGDSAWSIATLGSPNIENVNGTVTLDGRWANEIGIGNKDLRANGSGNTIHEGKNNGVSPPLTEFSLFWNTSDVLDGGRMRVYGRDL
jgi:hypothetical protein